MAEPASGLTPAPTTTTTAPTAISFGHHAPYFDLIELLPPQAAERLRQLRQRAADAHAIVPPFEDIREASAARTNAANALKRLTDHSQDGGFNLKPDARQVIEAQRLLDKLTADFTRLIDPQATGSAEFQASSAALANVEAWLRDGRPGGTVLEAVEIEPPKLLKGEDVLSAVERLRRRGRELKAAIHTIRSAPYPSSHAKAQMRAQIEALAQRGAPDATNLIEHDGKIDFEMQRVQSEVFNAQPGAVGFAEMPDVVGLLAWLHKDALIAALDREIAAESDDKAALSHTDRELRTSEAMSDLLAVERDESALVWRAMSEKLPCEHRADINPVAILQVQMVTTVKPNGQGTSPMHAYDVVGGGRRR